MKIFPDVRRARVTNEPTDWPCLTPHSGSRSAHNEMVSFKTPDYYWNAKGEAMDFSQGRHVPLKRGIEWLRSTIALLLAITPALVATNVGGDVVAVNAKCQTVSVGVHCPPSAPAPAVKPCESGFLARKKFCGLVGDCASVGDIFQRTATVWFECAAALDLKCVSSTLKCGHSLRAVVSLRGSVDPATNNIVAEDTCKWLVLGNSSLYRPGCRSTRLSSLGSGEVDVLPEGATQSDLQSLQPRSSGFQSSGGGW